MTPPPKKSFLIWSTLIILTFTAFFLFEIPAVQNETPGDTLSEYIWYLISLHPLLALTIAIPLVFLSVWLPNHWLFPGRFIDPYVVAYFKRLLKVKDDDKI